MSKRTIGVFMNCSGELRTHVLFDAATMRGSIHLFASAWLTIVNKRVLMKEKYNFRLLLLQSLPSISRIASIRLADGAAARKSTLRRKSLTSVLALAYFFGGKEFGESESQKVASNGSILRSMPSNGSSLAAGLNDGASNRSFDHVSMRSTISRSTSLVRLVFRAALRSASANRRAGTSGRNRVEMVANSNRTSKSVLA